ncbi:MAG: AraC family ligand binding domain-containing protein [Clostridium sp.]|nr:AraC family ligand binding domain-containing protein [Clostridium sp.]
MQTYNYTNNFYKSIDIMIYNTGYEECDPGHSYGPAVRKSYMIHYVTEGKGIFTINGKTYQLKKGDAFLMCPGEQIYYEADKKNPWCYAWIGMQGVKVESYLKKTAFANSPIIHYSKDDQLSLLYIKLQKAYSSDSRSRELLVNSVLYEILHFLINSVPNEKSDKDHNEKIYLNKIISYCAINIDKQIKVSELAQYLGLDRSYLTRLFKSEMKISLKDYILKTKIDEANDLLKNTDLPINVISRSVGFDDPLYFSRIYKEKQKISPKNYRNENNNS